MRSYAQTISPGRWDATDNMAKMICHHVALPRRPMPRRRTAGAAASSSLCPGPGGDAPAVAGCAEAIVTGNRDLSPTQDSLPGCEGAESTYLAPAELLRRRER